MNKKGSHFFFKRPLGVKALFALAAALFPPTSFCFEVQEPSKEEIKEIIEQLDKGSSDLKEHLDENNKEDPADLVGVRRKIHPMNSLYSDLAIR